MSTRKYFDTSAVIKLYVAEPETATIQAELLNCHVILVSRLSLLEYRSALYGKVRARQLKAPDAAAALQVLHQLARCLCHS